jgi:hypothetical protein
MVFEHESEYGSQWETIQSIASKIGCTAETIRLDFYRFRRRRSSPITVATGKTNQTICFAMSEEA